MRPLKLSRVFTLLEPGPVVLVTTHDEDKNNVMTVSWTSVLDFTPKFTITTGAWNHSFAALRKTKACVIAIPTIDMLDTVAGIGTCSGADTDKFAKFKLTALPGKIVKAPLLSALKRTSAFCPSSTCTMSDGMTRDSMMSSSLTGSNSRIVAPGATTPPEVW